jgi:hypothetical protein
MAKSTPNPTKASNKKTGKKPQTALNDPDLRRLRVMQVIQRRLQAMPIKDIAKELNIHPDTVDNDIAWAKKHGLLETLEQRLLGTIAQKTLNVIEAHLDMGNLDAAKEGMKFIIHANQQKARREEKQEDRDFDLEQYLAEKRRGAIDVTSTPVAPEGAPGAVLQGGPDGAPRGVAALLASPHSAGPGEDPDVPDDAPGGGPRRGHAAGDDPAGVEG